MANEIAKAYVQIVPSTEGLSGAISNAVGPEAEKAGEEGGRKYGGGFGKALKVVGGVAAAAAGVALKATAEIVKSAVSSYADFEQLVGGVETLFGAGGMNLDQYATAMGMSSQQATGTFYRLMNAQDEVLEHARNAYMTAGLSANAYMETVTSFSASLIQSLGGDTMAAAKYADMAITDMSDNANKMGTSMEMIQNAYNGFAKQNYTMLDNLKLGYGGTKEEMERLLKDAEAISGIEYNLDSYADVVDAIHVIQTEMGITETTAREAMGTISGAMGMTKAAWENLLTGLGSGEDLSPLIDNLVTSAEALWTNLQPVILNALQGISSFIAEVAPTIAGELPGIITSIAPDIATAAGDVLTTFVTAISQNLGSLTQTAIDIVMELFNALVSNLGPLVQGAIEIIGQLAVGIGEALPTLIPTIIDTLLSIVQYLIDNMDILLDGVISIITGLAQGIIDALPILIGRLPELISGVVDFLLGALPDLINAVIDVINMIINELPTIIAMIVEVLPDLITGIITGLMDNLPAIIEAGITLFLSLVTALPQIILGIVEAIPQIIDGLVNGFKNAWPQIKEAGINLLKNLWTGIQTFFPQLLSKVVEFVKRIPTAISNAFSKISEVGKNLIQGLWNGINNAKDWILEKIKGFGDAVLNGLKDFFGINSPSKVMADEIGKFLPEGIAVGITANADSVNDALDGLGAGAIAEVQSGSFSLGGALADNNESTMTQVVGLLQALLNKDMDFYIDGDVLVGSTANRMDVALGRLANARGRGR